MCEKSNNNNNDNEKYYRILELKPDASFLEVKSAYLHLKKLYSSKPLVMEPIMDEISEEMQLKILDQLEEAYVKLKEFFTAKDQTKIKTAKERVARHNVPEFEVFSGNALRLTREVLGIDLKEIALYSGVSLSHLKNIELERFDLLPPIGYIKVFLKKYAEYLSLDSKKVIKDYLKRFDKKK
jgi:hypothetical protein